MVSTTVSGYWAPGSDSTVILTESLPVAPSLSVAVRVMVCVPTERSFLVKEVPVPI